MNQNAKGFMIGVVGAAVTLGAYSQETFTTTQCMGIGLVILMFGLLVKEGLIDI